MYALWSYMKILKQFYLILQNLVEHLRPKRVVFLTDVDGIYDKPPEKEGQWCSFTTCWYFLILDFQLYQQINSFVPPANMNDKFTTGAD